MMRVNAGSDLVRAMRVGGMEAHTVAKSNGEVNQSSKKQKQGLSGAERNAMQVDKANLFTQETPQPQQNKINTLNKP